MIDLDTTKEIEGFIFENKPSANLLKTEKVIVFTKENLSSGIGIKTYKATLTIKEEVRP